MGNIKIEFSAEEVAALVSLMQENHEQIAQSPELLKLVTEISKKIIAAQSDSDKKELITAQVKSALYRLTGVKPENIKNTDTLSDDLSMTPQQIKSLTIPFTNIARQYKLNALISMDECMQCKTVQSCVDLIMGKIK
jgi:hypothetical protein